MRQELVEVRGMHCAGCEQAIERAVLACGGVIRVKASQARGQVAVEFDTSRVRFDQLLRAIHEAGYVIGGDDRPRWLRLLLFIGVLVLVGGVALWGKSLMPGVMVQMNAPRLDHLALLGIGFLTGFHCIGMCGGFVVGYAVSDRSRSPMQTLAAHAAYGTGKTLSYAVLGAVFGAIGALITVTPQLRGGLAIFAGLFLVLFGLKMLDLFSGLRHFGFRLPNAWVSAVGGGIRARRNPLIVGLLSGLLLGCGPLQALYVMALGTGDPWEGGAMLAWFGLGTLPPLLGFGLFASILGRRFMGELVRVSGVLMLVMGLMMTDRGLKLTQSGFDIGSLKQRWMLDEAVPAPSHRNAMMH